MSKADAYFAGLFDGEGHIQIKRLYPGTNSKSISPIYSLTLTLKMTHEETIRKLHVYSGVGYVYLNILKNPKHNDVWVWTVGAQSANDFLKKLLPYLITKKKEAEIAIGFYKICKRSSFGNKKVDPEMNKVRESYRLALLKARIKTKTFFQ